MKIVNKNLLALSILILLLFPVAGFPMKISFFLGQVTVTQDGKSASVKMGDLIKDGDVIRTAKGAIVEVIYDDSSKITIQENTIVQIGSKKIRSSSDITIIAGSINGKFGKLKKGVHRINTPTTVCSVRGTEFGVSVSKGGDSMVCLKEGSLDVDNPYGKVQLDEGQSIEAELGESPEVKNKILNSDEWESDKNQDVVEGIDERAGKYSKQFDQLEANNEKNQSKVMKLSARTKKIATKKELEKSGMEIAAAEEDIEHDILMNEASKLNAENLMRDYEGSEHYTELGKMTQKGDAVMERQEKSYQAVQKVKQEYKEAYDRIMKKYKDDKSGIFKNLDDYKKSIQINRDNQ